MNPKFSANLENNVKHVLEKRNIKVIKCEKSGNSGKGEGYLGDIKFLTIAGKNGLGTEKIYNLVLKVGKQENLLRKNEIIQKCFKNEAYVYEEILPAFRKFQHEKGIENNIFDAYPKYYGSALSEENEVLVFDNLYIKGYTLWNRNTPMNIEHIKRVLTEYGKFHAISMAIEYQKPELFKKLSTNRTDILITLWKKNNTLKPMKKNFLQACELFKNEEKLHSNLLNAATQFDNFIDDVLKSNHPRKVLTHGDNWNNNFMFKYNDEKNINPSNVAILDWQISRLSSPIYDLAYFLYCCASKNELNHFDELIQTYYNSFSTFLKQLGSDPHAIYPYDVFISDWKNLAKYGLYLSATILKICLCSEDECPECPNEFGEETKKGTSFDYFSFEIKNNFEYESRLRNLVEHFIEKNFI